MIDPLAPATVETARLRLRPPGPHDAPFHHALHSDPATFVHAPWALEADPVRNRLGLELWLEHWASEGFGYWVVEDRATGRPVGVAGVRRRTEGPGLNLYYRFGAGSHGRGLGREAARAAVVWAAEWLAGEELLAVVRPENVASERTALGAGLSRTGTHRHPGDPQGAAPSVVLQAPRVATERPHEGVFEEMLDVWHAVVAAGGAVGFLRDAPREAVAARLEDELARTSDDDAPLVTTREAATGRLLGFCWWVRDPFELFAHSVVLKRFMVRPDVQGRNLGAVQLCGAHAVARALPDVDLLRLSYRSGLGLGLFYGRHGWVETGREPGLIRVGPGDHRDSVTMARRPDGGSLVADGRP